MQLLLDKSSVAGIQHHTADKINKQLVEKSKAKEPYTHIHSSSRQKNNLLVTFNFKTPHQAWSQFCSLRCMASYIGVFQKESQNQLY